jgi:hypothetical protein
MVDRRRRKADKDSPWFSRALIVAGVLVLAVVTTLLLILQDQLEETRTGLRQAQTDLERAQGNLEAAGAERDRQEELLQEIRTQARLNACLSLKLAKRHGINTAGLDSPACRVFPDGKVVFPGAGPGSPLNAGTQAPERTDGANPAEGSKPGTPGGPPSPTPPHPAPGPGAPGPGPEPPGPTPSPIVTCIDIPEPLPDFCFNPPPSP